MNLIGELAARGVRANQVVIADDKNLQIAGYFDFDVLVMKNGELGRRVNTGFKYAAAAGADYVCFVGSDDWMHIDMFQPLLDSGDRRNTVFSGTEITLVDTPRRVMTTVKSTASYGVIPWLIPTRALEACHFEPIRPYWNRGLDHALYWELRNENWRFHDPHPYVRVDFKSETNITPYYHGRPEMPLTGLREWYPADLVDLIEELP